MDFVRDDISNSKNQYLSGKEKWSETEVNNYKGKKKLELMEPWVRAFLLLGIYAVVTMLIWAANITLGMLEISFFPPSWLITLVLMIIFPVISVIAGLLRGKKNNQQFIIDNRGEVGHHGNPYANGVKFSLFVSIAVLVIAIIGVVAGDIIYLMSGEGSVFDFAEFFSMDLLGSLMCIVGAAVYPLFYFIRSLSVLKDFDGDRCPICRRSNFRVIKRAIDKAKDDEISRKIAYTPGKIACVYGEFVIDKTKDYRETDMNSFITYCRYCSLYMQGNGGN